MSENDQNILPAVDEPGDDALASRLTRHLSGELDGQLGRSAAAFRRHVLAERTAPARPEPRPVWRGGPWTFAVVGGAVAASIALLVSSAAPLLQPTVTSGPGPGTMQVASPPVVRTDRTVRTHYYDAGTVIGADGRPLRRIRKVDVQELRWRNETTGEQVEQVVPTEEEVLYELKTY